MLLEDGASLVIRLVLLLIDLDDVIGSVSKYLLDVLLQFDFLEFFLFFLIIMYLFFRKRNLLDLIVLIIISVDHFESDLIVGLLILKTLHVDPICVFVELVGVI